MILNEADYFLMSENASEYSKIFHRRTFKEYYKLEQKLSVLPFVCSLFRLILILEMAIMSLKLCCLANYTISNTQDVLLP